MTTAQVHPSEALQFYPLGDAAIVIQFDAVIATVTNRKLRAISAYLEEQSFDWLLGYVPAFANISIYYDPLLIGYVKLKALLEKKLKAVLLAEAVEEPTEVVEIPVIYGGEYGPDLDVVAQHTGLSVAEVIRRHSDVEYLVYMIGFTPGFPYLGGMDPALAVPRKDSPRAKIASGAVGIAGQQTGIYPMESPGGWQIIGRTAADLFDRNRNPPALLKAGDRLRFVSITEDNYHKLLKEKKVPAEENQAKKGKGIHVLKAGLLSTVQDLGRMAHRKDGITPSGAMDAFALRLGNILLGNPEGSAGLECTVLGPAIEFESNRLILLAGADLSAKINGDAIPLWRPIRVAAGDRLTFAAAVSGCRCYLLVAGGFDVPELLGSKSTHLKAAFGGWQGRALKSGDRIPFAVEKSVAPPAQLNWSLAPEVYRPIEGQTIRVIKGPEFDLFTEQSVFSFFTEGFEVGKAADRMGYCLSGHALKLREQRDMLSSAVAFGTIQVTSVGDPIVLMADHQTTGGYPRIAHVITADLSRLAQMQQGDQITFELVTLAEAQLLFVQMELQLKQLKQTMTFKYPNNDL
ncbi:putative allophanate hydrolase [Pedobacter sp. BAL39]|uniref:5-oxoprolinase subunit PxpB n=1 Tax=Pedobacter sp. BAL39 TaxID=391596 RepID=UPI000155AD80|nr:5-oxoprolinase subunit PxpB [Pedobacter sp. BAL39]EDM34158.1 putative allophanate hydrolase [Pedobacter sp. BAL39]